MKIRPQLRTVSRVSSLKGSIGWRRACALCVLNGLKGPELVLLERKLVDERREGRIDGLARTIGIIALEIGACGTRLTVDIGGNVPSVLRRNHRCVVMRAEGHVGADEC